MNYNTINFRKLNCTPNELVHRLFIKYRSLSTIFSSLDEFSVLSKRYIIGSIIFDYLTNLKVGVLFFDGILCYIFYDDVSGCILSKIKMQMKVGKNRTMNTVSIDNTIDSVHYFSTDQFINNDDTNSNLICEGGKVLIYKSDKVIRIDLDEIIKRYDFSEILFWYNGIKDIKSIDHFVCNKENNNYRINFLNVPNDNFMIKSRINIITSYSYHKSTDFLIDGYMDLLSKEYKYEVIKEKTDFDGRG